MTHEFYFKIGMWFFTLNFMEQLQIFIFLIYQFGCFFRVTLNKKFDFFQKLILRKNLSFLLSFLCIIPDS